MSTGPLQQHPAPDGVRTRLHVDTDARAGALFTFDFRTGTGNVACPVLDAVAPIEAWRADHDIVRTGDRHLSQARAGDYAFVTVRVRERDGDICAAADTAYRLLLAHVRHSSTPNILRIWNYFAAINHGTGDDERYRRFCVGRAHAVDARFNDPPPAATAIGTIGQPDVLDVIALCSAHPGIALENPRQTPAWRYPREYGPVPPGFSRAALIGHGADQRLLVSGTASIVGHVSQHLGDPVAQVAETFANLHALLAHASTYGEGTYTLTRCASLRIYLRDPAHLAAVRTAVLAQLSVRPPLLFLHGEVCRRELALELEGVFLPA